MFKLKLFAPLFLVFVLLIGCFSPVVKMSENISKNVFRLHIIANSDSEFDQKLKLCVRDNVLNLTEDLYKSCDCVGDAVNLTKNNIDIINDIAQKTVNSYGYKVKSYVCREYFNTRYYDTFTLPAGVYNSLKIEIGKAEGHNWWCVMYPTVCITGCTDDFSKTLSDEEKSMLVSDKYIVRFKVVEIYEKVKSKLSS